MIIMCLGFASFGAVIASAVSSNQPIPTIIESGSMVTAADLIVFQYNGYNYVKSGDNGTILFNDNNAQTAIQWALNFLTYTRNYQMTLVIKGDFNINLEAYSGGTVYAGLLVPSQIIIEILGSLNIINNADSMVGRQNYLIRGANVQNVTITGGEINGNMANQISGHIIYGIEFADSSNILIENVYVQNTQETGIALEGHSFDCKVMNCQVMNGDEDGIGNQYTCYNILYFGNTVCLGAGMADGNIYIEGGTNIVAESNTVFGTLASQSTVGIDITRGQPDPAMSVSILNNVIYGCTYGISTRDYAQNVTIEGNKIYDSLAEGIILQSTNSKYDIISNNQVYDNDQSGTQHSGILIVSASHIMLDANMCYNHIPNTYQDYGIAFISGANNCTIHDNDVRNNQYSAGIYTDGSTKNMVYANNVGSILG